jgi:hypothetical protein
MTFLLQIHTGLLNVHLKKDNLALASAVRTHILSNLYMTNDGADFKLNYDPSSDHSFRTV